MATKIKVTQTIIHAGVDRRVAKVFQVAPFGVPSGIPAEAFTQKGSVLVGLGASNYAEFPPGSDGHTLIYDSGEASGFRSGLPASAASSATGTLVNGMIVPSVASNNLTLALKTLTGNDPTADDPITITIAGEVRSITSPMSVTKNAGTNWANLGSAELATKENDLFAYVGYNATDGLTIGFSRISFARQYGDFSTTSTNEKYAAISTITNAAASDEYVNIGRFAATLGAGASYNWSVPTFTPANLVQRPIMETRHTTFATQITYAGGTTDPTSNTVTTQYYALIGRLMIVHVASTLVKGAGNRPFINYSLPWTGYYAFAFYGFGSISGSNKFPIACYSGTGKATFSETMSSDGTVAITVVSLI